jgi:hypothetical protein
MIRALEDLYPETEWYEWLFRQTRENFWTLRKNQKRYMDWVMQVRGMKDLTDWYNIRDLAFDEQRGV